MEQSKSECTAHKYLSNLILIENLIIQKIETPMSTKEQTWNTSLTEIKLLQL